MKFILSLCWFLAAGFLCGAASANEGMVTMDDTLVFDLSQASFSNDGDLIYIEFPVIIQSTDPSINAVDFWYQFNLEKMTYVSTTSLIGVLDVFSYYNQNNEFLSNTSSTTSKMVYLPLGIPIMNLKFSLADPCTDILDTDFYTPTALVNGIVSSSLFIAGIPGESEPIEIVTPEPYCSRNDIVFTYSNQIHGQDIVQYDWDFGNGLTGSGQTDTTNFHAGTYIVTLDVVTDAGCTYSITTSIDILPTPLVEFTTYYDAENDEVLFTNLTTISNGSGVTFLWEFGDDQTSELFSPTHQYAAQGFYDVTLTATSDAGCAASVTHNISSTTGMEELASLDQVIDIFPNPANAELTLRTSKRMQFFIVDDIGRQVSEVQKATPSVNKSIDVSSLAAGLYIVVGYDEYGQYQKRFVIQHD